MIRYARLWLLLGFACACGSGKSQGAGGSDTQLGSGSGGGGAGAFGSTGGSSSGGAASGGDAGGGGTSVETPCDRNRCDGAFACCTEAGTCGKEAPIQIFRSTCVASAPRGGELSESCPDSPAFCQRSRCRIFRGCALGASGGAQGGQACGYWVEQWEIVGGEETSVVIAPLGCVPVEEFVSP